MVISAVIMGILAIVLSLLAYGKGGGEHIIGLKSAMAMTIQVLPIVIFAFIVAGMLQVLIPQEVVARWIGKESGIKGILIGTLVGAVAPGNPYVNLPIAAGLLRSGASLGAMVAFLTGWSLWSVTRLPLEVGIMGWKFTLVRIISTFFFPPLAGVIANNLFS